MTVTIERGPQCECGCGEYLPIGSARKYKRGHRANVNSAMADQMEYNFNFEPGYNTEPINPNYRSPDVDWDDDAGWVSLEDAANATPNDPTGAPWEDASKPEFIFSLPKKVQADIEGKLAFMLSTTGMAVSMPDPICGQAIINNTPEIAKALTPIICQSPGVVAWFQKTSNIMLYINLAMAMAPLVATILGHHLPSRNRNNFNGPPQNGHMDIPMDPSNYYTVQ